MYVCVLFCLLTCILVPPHTHTYCTRASCCSNGTVSPNGGYDDAWIMAGWKEGQAPVKVGALDWIGLFVPLRKATFALSLERDLRPHGTDPT